VQRAFIDSSCIKITHTWIGDVSTTATGRSVLYSYFQLIFSCSPCKNIISRLWACLLYLMIVSGSGSNLLANIFKKKKSNGIFGACIKTALNKLHSSSFPLTYYSPFKKACSMHISAYSTYLLVQTILHPFFSHHTNSK
jgi:hypothetical protein